MPPPLTIAPQARADLAEIRAYYRREAGAQVSARMSARFRAAFLRIAASPMLGPVRTDWGGEVRLRVVRPYIIYVAAHADRTEILRILHHARDRDAIMSGGT